MEPLPLLIIAALVVILPVIYVIGQFNGFVALKNHTAEAWSNIDTELKRRYELIPNLVRTVEAYAKHERVVLDRVTQLRSSCMASNGTPTEQAAGESQLSGALRQMLAIAESYPDLKADQNFLQLQEELVNTEDRIQAARRFYNGNVRDYRNKYESFPTNLIASAFGFEPLEFLEIESVVRQAPAVSLGA
jgi:LemA protein